MKSKLDAYVGQRLVHWVSSIQANTSNTLMLLAACTIALGAIAALKLGINSNNLDLLSPEIESRQYQAEFSAVFPDIENALFIVIDAASPWQVQSAATQLGSQLAKDTRRFNRISTPNGGEFFSRNGLLYLSLDELEELALKLRRLRPVLISLEANPNFAGLANIVVKNMRVTRFSFDYESTWLPVLDGLSLAIEETLNESTTNSTTSLLDQAFSDAGNSRQIVIAHPNLEFGSVLAAHDAITAIRSTADELGISAENGFDLRVTGNPALNFEEMWGIAWDIGVAGIFCFALVIVVLLFALRSIQLVAASVVTLLVGLVWMTGFAALLVGHLNIVSLSFAILFIGLGVDFAIHLGMSYADALKRGLDDNQAMLESVTKIGSSLFICTISTAIGFIVFVPTAYLGVAELGKIASAGMVVIFFLTITLFPALLSSVLRVKNTQTLTHDLKFEADLGLWVKAHSRFILASALGLFALSLFLAPKAKFDPNVIEMRDPDTESVQAFNELLDESGVASPWYVDVLAPNLAAANNLKEQALKLPTVDHAITAVDLVPSEQAEKISLLQNLSEEFLAIDQSDLNSDQKMAEALVAIKALQEHLVKDAKKSDTESFAAKQLGLVERLDELSNQLSGETLKTLEDSLVGDISGALGALRKSLSPERVSADSLPDDLSNQMLAPDGQARVQIFAQENLRDNANLREFVASVQALAPRATGMPVNLVAFEAATKNSFLQALISAFVLISLLLAYLWRNLVDMALVLSPLILSLLLTVSCMAIFQVPFNFTNVIVIPLLFGIGVDSGIHLVHRSHGTSPEDQNLLNTTTARAVYYSALTTFISFGSLSLSAHQGMSSLGTLLAIGMVLTVVCNLLVLPTLLERIKVRTSG